MALSDGEGLGVNQPALIRFRLTSLASSGSRHKVCHEELVDNNSDLPVISALSRWTSRVQVPSPAQIHEARRVVSASGFFVCGNFAFITPVDEFLINARAGGKTAAEGTDRIRRCQI